MARQKKPEGGKPIESYEHRDKERINNPPVGLVTPETDSDSVKSQNCCKFGSGYRFTATASG